MKKIFLALLATAALSMASCERQQQGTNQAQPQDSGQTAQNQPNEGQPQKSGQAAQNQPNQGQPQNSGQAAQTQPNQGQPQNSGQAAQTQPNQGQPQNSGQAAQTQPNEGQPQNSGQAAQTQPNESQPQNSNQTAQTPNEGEPQNGGQTNERQPQNSGQTAPSQPNERQPQNSNQTAQSQPNESQPQNSNQTAQNQPGQAPISPDNLSRDEIRQIQRALDESGFHAGAADGRWGPETSNALKQFQQSKNIQANGELDQQTLTGLGLNGAQFAQRNKRDGESGRSGSRPLPSLHPSTTLKARKSFQSRIAVSKWQAKWSPNIRRQTFFDGGRRHGTASAPWRAASAPWRTASAPWRAASAPWRAASAPWRAHVFVPNAVFVGGTYAGSDPDPNIRAALRREFGRF
jgi:hypothetical protein